MIASQLVAPVNTGYCGPLEIKVHTSDERFASVATQFFDHYGEARIPASRHIEVRVDRYASAPPAEGRFLRCARMNVDRNGDVYFASTESGFTARGISGDKVDIWNIALPPQSVSTIAEVGDVEDLLGLVCTVGWRREGFVPVHAGAVAKNDRCVVLCAPSGGGKSTLTAALLRNGWRALGDDKLLLRHDAGQSELIGLLQTFNLHPQTRSWFPDMDDLEALPRYSCRTEKRRVSVSSIAAAGALSHATPTHVARIFRTPWIDGVCATEMRRSEVLPTLLQQIVLPTDREASGAIVRTVSRCAAHLRGIVFEVGEDAYRNPEWLSAFEEALG